jgi:hypothetical protein
MKYFVSAVCLIGVFAALSQPAKADSRTYTLKWEEVTKRIDGTPVDSVVYQVKSGDYTHETEGTKAPLPSIDYGEVCVRALEGIVPSDWSCANIAPQPSRPIIRIVISVE